MNRHRLLIAAAVLAVILPLVATRALALDPETITWNAARTTSGETLSGLFYRGNTYRGTLTFYSDANATTTQSLTNIRIDVVVGNESATATTNGTITAEATGSATFDWTCLTNNTAGQVVQITLVDTNASPNVSYTYPQYTYSTKALLE